MAVDTANKRASLVGLGLPVPRLLPAPSAAFDTQGEREMLAYLYAFHDAAAAVVDGPGERPRLYWGVATRRLGRVRRYAYGLGEAGWHPLPRTQVAAGEAWAARAAVSGRAKAACPARRRAETGRLVPAALRAEASAAVTRSGPRAVAACGRGKASGRVTVAAVASVVTDDLAALVALLL